MKLHSKKLLRKEHHESWTQRTHRIQHIQANYTSLQNIADSVE